MQAVVVGARAQWGRLELPDDDHTAIRLIEPPNLALPNGRASRARI
jgi:hypothetical protein